MNVVTYGFLDRTHAPLLREILTAADARRAFIFYYDHKIEPPPGVQVTFHSWEDVNWRADYGVDLNSLTPLDEDLIERMYPYEAVFLKMCDRLESRGQVPYLERKRLWHHHLRYWNHVVEKEDIRLYVNSNVPHETFDYVIYAVCKSRGIPCLLFYHTLIADTSIEMEDIHRPSLAMRRRYEELRGELADTPTEAVRLAPRFQRHFAQMTEQASPAPFYMRPAPRPPLIERARTAVKQAIDLAPLYARDALDPDAWARRRRRLRVERGYRRDTLSLRALYDGLASEPDLSQAYVYLALHFQPEASTCPMGGAFVDQLLMAQMLAAHLPPGVSLYVKEHPHQVGFGRSRAFYEELQSVPRVRLVPRGFDTFRLSDHAIAVATATGTAGWEALYRGKPVLLFGHTFFQYAPGVFPIRTNQDCAEALRLIVDGQGLPTHRDLKIFLKALEETTLHGYIDPLYEKISLLSARENIENLASGIGQRVRALRAQEAGATELTGKPRVALT